MKATLLCTAALIMLSATADAQSGERATFVLPHVLERAGRVTAMPRTTDFNIHLVSLERRSVELYLYDAASGEPLKSRTGADVCNPCTIEFARSPKQVVSIEDLVIAAGGFARPVVSAYATLNTKGSKSLEGVAVQALSISSNSGPFDLSVFGFEPQPIAAEAP